MGRHCRWWPRGRVAAAGAGRWRARPLRPPLSASLRRVSLLALARTRHAYATLLRPRCRHLRLTLRFAILVPVASRRTQGTLRYACRPLSPALFPASCSPRFWATLRFAQTADASLRDLRTRRFAPDAQNASLRFPPPPAHGSRLPARRPSFVSLTACHSVRALPSRRVDPHAVRHSHHDGHARGAHSLAALITLAAAGSLFSSVACGDLTHPPPMWALSFFGGAGTRTTPVPPHVPPFIMCACAGFPQIRRRGR